MFTREEGDPSICELNAVQSPNSYLIICLEHPLASSEEDEFLAGQRDKEEQLTFGISCSLSRMALSVALTSICCSYSVFLTTLRLRSFLICAGRRRMAEANLDVSLCEH